MTWIKLLKNKNKPHTKTTHRKSITLKLQPKQINSFPIMNWIPLHESKTTEQEKKIRATTCNLNIQYKHLNQNAIYPGSQLKIEKETKRALSTRCQSKNGSFALFIPIQWWKQWHSNRTCTAYKHLNGICQTIQATMSRCTAWKNYDHAKTD